MIAVVPVRGGCVPIGGLDAAAEATGRLLLIGSGVEEAAAQFQGVATSIVLAEVGSFAPGAWARAIAKALESGIFDDGAASTDPEPQIPESLVLPHSPDGRDLGPRLAYELDLPLVAGAIEVGARFAQVALRGGLLMRHIRLDAPIVATLLPGVRATHPDSSFPEPSIRSVELELASDGSDPSVLRELPADPATMDLSEARRIVGGGAGLGSSEAFRSLSELTVLLGASTGGTRVVSDWGWIPFERQIGTTGVIVDPDLYIALGISGAVQHTAGLGSPNHVISVNTDPHCPMMAMADLAIVCDAPLFLSALLNQLSENIPPG